MYLVYLTIIYLTIIRNVSCIFTIKNSNAINSFAYKSFSTTLDRFLEVYSMKEYELF